MTGMTAAELLVIQRVGLDSLMFTFLVLVYRHTADIWDTMWQDVDVSEFCWYFLWLIYAPNTKDATRALDHDRLAK